jgi:hypothetical protein
MNMIRNCSKCINATIVDNSKVPYDALQNIESETLKYRQRVLDEKSGIERYLSKSHEGIVLSTFSVSRSMMVSFSYFIENQKEKD